MEKRFHCVVCGSCTVDVLVRPFPLGTAIASDELVRVDPIRASTGGMVSNAGTVMKRLGMQVAAFTYLGDDQWSDIVRQAYATAGIDSTWMPVRDGVVSSVSIVLIGEDGSRSFVHSQGAPKQIDRGLFLDNLKLFAQSEYMLLGYYPLLPHLLEDLADVMRQVRSTGCRTAMDAAGGGGTMRPLQHILPHLDVYVPSLAEASQQTGESNPKRMIDVYRACGAPGVLGVKLGADGAILSEAEGSYLRIHAISAPGKVVDTTGAGDAFCAGLMCGLTRGLPLADAGRLAAAAGAYCVTGIGATQAIRDYTETAALAGLPT